MDPTSYKIDSAAPPWTGEVPPEVTNADHLVSVHGWGRGNVTLNIGQLHDEHVTEHLLGTPLSTPHWHVELPERKSL